MKKKTKVAEKGDPRIDRKERVKSDCVEKDKEMIRVWISFDKNNEMGPM